MSIKSVSAQWNIVLGGRGGEEAEGADGNVKGRNVDRR